AGLSGLAGSATRRLHQRYEFCFPACPFAAGSKPVLLWLDRAPEICRTIEMPDRVFALKCDRNPGPGRMLLRDERLWGSPGRRALPGFFPIRFVLLQIDQAKPSSPV